MMSVSPAPLFSIPVPPHGPLPIWMSFVVSSVPEDVITTSDPTSEKVKMTDALATLLNAARPAAMMIVLKVFI